ncbi:Beta-xylosidase [compost metagenome]
MIGLLSKVNHADSYPILILPGDYPDPSIIRVDQDYYMTHSSFDYTPGLLIWHSRDLVNWERIGFAVHRSMGNIQAPDLIFYKGLFYIYFPAADTNWVITASSPTGPWSDPVDLKVGLIDPGHVADQEGNRYLFLSGGHMIQLSPDGLSTVGELIQLYEGWRYPHEWRTEGFYLESPKFTYQNGYYYMTSAQGGTAGPATSHMIVSARARSLSGPWENSPHNPILRTQHRGERWRSKGHGTLVDSVDGRWYVVYHAYEQDYLTLGRQTLMEPIVWDADGWFHTGEQLVTDLPPRSTADLPLSDRFVSDRLLPQWHFYGGKRLNDYTIGGGCLRLQGTPDECRQPLLCIPYHHAYETSVTIEAEDGAVGSLSLFYKPGFQCGIGFDGKYVFAFRGSYMTEYTEITGNTVTLRLVDDHHEVDLYYKTGASGWKKLDHSFEVSGFHTNVLGSFLSLRIALDAVGEGTVSFRDFTYKELSSY